ncbi:MAG: LuxR C-terminal-related transcriptional regulator, partial [Nitriliruptorales bacterium]
MPGGLGGASALEAGFAALERGDWGDARSSFAAALAAAETPAGFEGLGAAAWWLDDAATLFEARERAYRLYREADDALGAGRVASALAVDYLLLRAEPAVASGWIQRAHRLLDDLELCPEQGMLAAYEGGMAIDVSDDTVAAGAHAERAAEVGRLLGIADLEMLGLGIRGVALVTEGAVDEGMRLLDEATAAATGGDMREPVAIGLTCCNLMYACERVRDFDR